MSRIAKYPVAVPDKVQVTVDKGTLTVKNDDAFARNPWKIVVPAIGLAFEQCDSVILILGAGTNFLQDYSKQWLGAHPHAAIAKRVDAAARRSTET